ncbi:MAG: hypothetical protein KI790_08950 [Cyclobacteriaceae bacterium]|nr:hypothetical protein [Cyclobacteriaceae bacterium HetDA_MAG_MS6]
MVKVINLVRILSIVLFLIILALVYAYLPVMVQLQPGSRELLLNREYFFYCGAGLFLVINVFIWLLLKLISPLTTNSSEPVLAWLNALPFVINVYLTLLVGFVGVINNQLHISTKSYAYLNYLGPFLLFVWLSGVFYMLFVRRKN